MAKNNVQYSKKQRRLVMQENIAAYLFLLPFLVFFVGFVLYPMFMCVYTSFFDATMGREDIFVGFANLCGLRPGLVGDAGLTPCIPTVLTFRYSGRLSRP